MKLQIRDRLAPTRVAASKNTARGQSLVETALTLPFVLLLALGVTDVGRTFYYREAVANSVRQAIRVAVSPSQQATANSVCSGTSGGPVAATVTSAIPAAGGVVATVANEAALESSSTGAPAGSAISGANLTVTFHCLNGAAVTNATSNGNGPTDPGSDSVTVSIRYSFNIVTPLLWPVTGTSFPISITSSGRSEY